MLRVVGGSLIFWGTVWAGWKAGCGLTARTECLRELVGGLRHMERELSFRLTPLPELLTSMGKGLAPPLGGFFERCGRCASCADGTFEENWCRELERLHEWFAPGAIDCLHRLGRGIGRYNWEEGCKLISITVIELERYLREEEQENRRRGHLYRTLGITAGAFLIILLL